MTQPAAPSRGGGCASATWSFRCVAGAAALAVTVLVGLIVWKVVEQAWPAIQKYGLGFVTRVAWNPVLGRELYGAGSFLFGTAVTSLGALLLAAPIAIGDRALPHRARAAAPRRRSRRWSRRWPRSRASCSASGGSSSSARCCVRRSSPALTARSAGSRSSARRRRPARACSPPDHRAHDHGPADRRRASAASSSWASRTSSRKARSRSARRAGRWCAASSFRTRRGGIAAAMILGLGRALGEAIAVTQVIGGGVSIQWQPVRHRRHAGEQDRRRHTRARPLSSRPPR